MSKTFEKAVFDNMSAFTFWSLRNDFPINGFGIGLPQGYEFDPSLTDEERMKKAENDSTFCIFTTAPLTDEQKKEIWERLSVKFFQFIHIGTIERK